MLALSDGISSWTPLKPQHSNPNPNTLPNQLWYIDFLTPPTRLITPYSLSAFLESLIPLKNWCSINARCSKSSLKNSIRFWSIFPSLKQNFMAYRSSKVSSRPDCIFEIHQLWQSGFSRVYSNYCCSCSFEPEIIKLASHLINICLVHSIRFQTFFVEAFKIVVDSWKFSKLLLYIFLIPFVNWKWLGRTTKYIYKREDVQAIEDAIKSLWSLTTWQLCHC